MTAYEIQFTAAMAFVFFAFTAWAWRWTRHSWAIAFCAALALFAVVSYLIALDTAKVAVCGADWQCGREYVARHFLR